MLSLLAPWFLVGLGALSVPVLVHLIQKERKDVVAFPSLMFLQQIPYKSVRRQQIRHWLLFLLRCLAVVLLVLAFARPFFRTQRAAAAGLSTGGRDIVITLDRSYSMGYGDRWRRAVAAAKDVVQRMSGSDRAAVIYFSGTAWAAGDLTSDKTAVLAAIDSARPTDGVTRYDAAFRLVQHVLGDTARPNSEVVLVSDNQRAGWRAHELPSLPPETKLTQVNVSDGATADVAVTDVTVRYDTADGRERATVEATLANHGATPVRNRPVTFTLNGRRLQTRPVDCPANGIVRVAFDPVPPPPGSSSGIVSTGPDALETDNRFYFMIVHDASLPVLVVQAPDAGATAGRFLTTALGLGGRLSFRIRTVRPSQLSAGELGRTALVVLNDTPIPSGDAGHQLLEYVRGGGGLLVVLGSHSHPETWPEFANQLLPRPSGQVVDRSAQLGATLEFLDRGHPVFEAFNTPHSGDFSAARFLHYWTVKPDAGDQSLARFDDGRPALLERRIGTGRVLVWSSDLDGAWNDFPLQPVFLPLMHQVAKYAAGYDETRQWMTIGDVLTLPSLFGETVRGAEHPTTDAAQYVIISPNGTQIRFKTSPSDAPPSLELTQQGVYTITRTGGAGDSTQTVAANLDLAEADLTPLDSGALAAAVTPRPATREQQARGMGTLVPSELEQRQSVWWYLLLTALLLLGAETLLSNRLSRAVR